MLQVFQSFPTRERGLKYLVDCPCPFEEKVVPHAGTWIEIVVVGGVAVDVVSFPTRERGLKSR